MNRNVYIKCWEFAEDSGYEALKLLFMLEAIFPSHLSQLN